MFWLGFALLSGTEKDFEGLLANLPNTLPWLGLLAVLYMAFRREMLGGALASAVGLASVFFFTTVHLRR